MVTRIAFSTAVREAAVTLLTSYAAAEQLKLQVYRARPASVNPPCAFVDRMTERYDYPSSTTWRQRYPRAEVIVLHGLFDSGEAVDQRDAFVDGFLDYVTDSIHAAGASTTIALVLTEDIPVYVPDWQAPALQRSYYGTRLTLEGFAGG